MLANNKRARKEEVDEKMVAEDEDKAFLSMKLVRPAKPVHHGAASGARLLPKLVAVDDYISATPARIQYDVDGKGQLVAVLDTGLYAEHEDFKGRVVKGKNFSDGPGDENNTADPFGEGHGTNVAGIICSNGPSNIPSRREHIGIAPGASIMPFKVFGEDETFTPVHRSLEWIVNYNNSKPKMPITAVSMSLGDTGNYKTEPAGSTKTRRLIQQLRAQRCPVLIAAGNDYFTNKSEPGMSFPAIIRECISVGAVYDKVINKPLGYEDGAAASSARPGQITPFSQRLHMKFAPANYTKIFAPGAPVISTGFGDGNQTEPTKPHDPRDGWSTMDGTSQATPVVTGVVLLIQELWKRHTGVLPTVDEILYCLVTDRTIVDSDLGVDNVRHSGLSYPVIHLPSILKKAAARISVISEANYRPMFSLKNPDLSTVFRGATAAVKAFSSVLRANGGAGSSAAPLALYAPSAANADSFFDFNNDDESAATEAAEAAAGVGPGGGGSNGDGFGLGGSGGSLAGCVSAVEEALATCRSRSANISVQGRALTTKEQVQLQALQDASSKLAEALRMLQV